MARSGFSFSKDGIKKLIKTVAPWLAAFIILVFIFHQIDVKVLIDSFRGVNFILYAALFALFSLASFIMDSFNISSVLKKFGYHIELAEIYKIRGLTYLAMILNYAIGMGGIAVYLTKYMKIPMSRAMGAMFIYNTATQNCLAFISFIASLFFMNDELISKVFYVSLFIMGFSFLCIFILKYLKRKSVRFSFPGWQMISMYGELSMLDYLILISGRILYYLIFIIFFYAGFYIFHIKVPLLNVMAFIPMILLIISLPVTPLGLGSSQAAMVFFFEGFGTRESILAFSLVYSVSIIISRGAIGLCYLLKTSGNIDKILLTEKIDHG